MGNNVTLIPKKPERHSLLTSTENIVYMPLASRESHGIVKVGDGLNITTDGLLSVDFSSKWYSDIKLDVDALKIDVEEAKTDLAKIGDDFINIEERVSDVEEGRKIISIYQTKRDTGLVTLDKTVVGGINELKNQTQININDIRVNKTNIGDIKQNYATTKYVDNLYSKMSVGGNNSYVFETREQFISWLDGTFTREDLFKPELLKIGDVIFIEEMGVPDYWVKSKNSPMTINDFREYEAKIDIPEIKYDGISISKNALGELQAIAIKNGRLIITDDVNRSDFGGWVELSEAQYNELVEYGSITVGDKIIEYSENDVYITPDTSYSVKQGTTPPTQDTTGEPGQFYLDVVTKKLYVCTATNEWMDVSSTDLTDYVKNTDYGTNSKAGLVQNRNEFGTYINPSNGVLSLVAATDTIIDSKTNKYMPIVPKNLDYAVKVGITTNTETLTEEEKQKAKDWLGITNDSDLVKREEFEKVYNKTTDTLKVQNIELDGENIKPATDFANAEREKSKNLIGLENTTIEINGVTITIENEKITAVGTPTQDTVLELPLISNIDLLADKKYIASLQDAQQPGASSFVVKFYDSNGTFINGMTVGVTSFTFSGLGEDTKISKVTLEFANYPVDFTFKIQIEEGTSVTSHKVYNGAIVHEKDLKEAMSNAGGKKYLHKIRIYQQNTVDICVHLINNSNTKLNSMGALATYLYNDGTRIGNTMATGAVHTTNYIGFVSTIYATGKYDLIVTMLENANYQTVDYTLDNGPSYSDIIQEL